jgi:hypothetical protein
MPTTERPDSEDPTSRPTRPPTSNNPARRPKTLKDPSFGREGEAAMWAPRRAIRLRTLLLGIAALALILAAAQESILWSQNRGRVRFHVRRAEWLRERAVPHRSRHPDAWRGYQELAAWHDERADMYRKARSTSLSEPLKHDLRQTMREQEFEQSLVAGPGGGATKP